MERLLVAAAGLLVVKITASVVWNYRHYLPPDFAADFLQGRQAYFFGPYQWAFYAHLASGPLTLILGLLLVSERFRLRFPRWHRTLGKTQILLIVLLLAPSGLWMARYAETGVVAGTGFSLLAVATAAVALAGWRTAVQRRFVEHRRWMWCCFLLLCSAVVIRLIGGLGTVAEIGWAGSYPLAAWASWLVPLAVFELIGPVQPWLRRFGLVGERQYSPPITASSSPAMEISRTPLSGRQVERHEPDVAVDENYMKSAGMTWFEVRANAHHDRLVRIDRCHPRNCVLGIDFDQHQRLGSAIGDLGEASPFRRAERTLRRDDG